MLDKLHKTIFKRKQQWQAGECSDSYVCKLFESGLDVTLKKVGEESTEFVIAAKNNSKQELLHEAADLWFHTLVALAHHDIGYQEVLAVLEERHKTHSQKKEA